MRMVVTGGAGFVGSSLSILFKKDNPSWSVTSLDNLKRRGSELNISRLKATGVEFCHGDIRNKEDLSGLGNFDVMVECSAEPSVLAGYNESPEYLINTNLIGTVNCLEAARKCKAAVIFLSTSRVYPVKTINELRYQELDTRFRLNEDQSVRGASSRGFSEEFPLDGTRSLYGTTKLASELLLQEYIEMYGLRGVINRCGVLTGPWQMGKVDQGVVVLWVARHIFHGKLNYIGYGGTGKQVRDLLHVNDLYRLVCLQLSHLNGINGKVYNVGGGLDGSLSLREMTDLCQQITGNNIQIDSIVENRAADIPYYVTDNSKLINELGWTPNISVTDTIVEICDWIKENAVLLKNILA